MKNKTYKKNLDQIHRGIPCDYYVRGIKNNIFQAYYHKKRFKSIKKIIGNIKTNNILDIGCHSGLLTNLIKKWTGATIYGIDISESAINYAQKIYPEINFLSQDIENGLSFEKNNFDIITCFDTLEHLIKIENVLRDINNKLRNEGYFIIGIPNENILFKIIWFIWTKTSGKVWEDAHVHHFNDKSIDEIITKHGFKLVERYKIHMGIYHITKYQKYEK